MKTGVTQWVQDTIQLEMENRFIWIPILMIIGVCIANHCNITATLSCVLISITAITVLNKSNTIPLIILHTLFSITLYIAIGALSMQYHTHRTTDSRISTKLENIRIIGTIKQIRHNDGKLKLLLDDPIFPDTREGSASEELHNVKSVRITTPQKRINYDIGDVLSMRATLMPPPGPMYPGGFRFDQYALFNGIDAIGYTTSKIRLLDTMHNSSFEKKLNFVREYIAEHITEDLKDEKLGIALALLIGDSSRINSQDYDAIRRAGIAHMLAISGMHMVIVTGIMFVSIRRILSCLNTLAARINIKKLAAIISISISFAYLLIAHYPISAQRAFIMSSLVMIGVMLDRRSNGYRSISIAAIVILIFSPDAIFYPSFQMSFSATIYLLAAYYRSARDKSPYNYFMAIVKGSTISTLATAPFSLYHFHQISTYSIITNIICIPIADFIVMPFGILSLLLIPFNLHHYTLDVMGCFIATILYVAKAISNLPNATLYVPAMSNCIFIPAVAGIIIIVSMKSTLRYIGVFLLVCFLVELMNLSKPDILLSDSTFAILRPDGYYDISTRGRYKYLISIWEEAYNAGSQMKTISRTKSCNSRSCIYEKHGHKVAILLDTAHLKQVCEVHTPSVFVNLSDTDYTCVSADMNLKKSDIEQQGVHTITIRDKIRINHSR